jgi:hypothetical protein
MVEFLIILREDLVLLDADVGLGFTLPDLELRQFLAFLPLTL